MKDNRKKRKRFLPIWFLLIALLIGGCGSETESRQTDAITQQTLTETADTLEETQEQRAVVASDETESAAKTQDEITDYATEKNSVLTMDEIPAFADAPYVVIDDNEPDFQESDYSETSYEYYSDLDELGRFKYRKRSDANEKTRFDRKSKTERLAYSKIRFCRRQISL